MLNLNVSNKARPPESRNDVHNIKLYAFNFLWRIFCLILPYTVIILFNFFNLIYSLILFLKIPSPKISNLTSL